MEAVLRACSHAHVLVSLQIARDFLKISFRSVDLKLEIDHEDYLPAVHRG